MTAAGVVGAAIGANNQPQAKRYAAVAIAYCIFISGIISILLFTCSETIARVFTRDPDTIAEIVYTLPAVAIYILFSGW